MQFKFLKLEFNPTVFGTFVTLACIPLFIKLGLWQYNKAMLKQRIQDEYVQSAAKGVLDLSKHLQDSEMLQYQKIKVSGEYETKYQILIDNQVEQEQAGFNVVTPLKILNTPQYVLVNRGWIAGKANHMEIPNFETPRGVQQIEGMVWLPTKKIFTLEDKVPENQTSKSWNLVWQNLDMLKFQKSAPINVLPVIVKLDPKSTTGGFVRNWQAPAERIMTNLGYAYQWFGFAFAAFAIYLYMSFNRIK